MTIVWLRAVNLNLVFLRASSCRGLARFFLVHDNMGEGAEAKAYIVSDFKGAADNLGFAQPVSYDRLTLAEVLPLAHAEDGIKTRITVDDTDGSRSGAVKNQRVDSTVYIEFDDKPGQGQLLEQSSRSSLVYCCVNNTLLLRRAF